MNNIQNNNTVGATLHNPARHADETFEAYKIRRKESKTAAKENSQIGKGGISTRKSQRDELRNNGNMKFIAGSYGRGLRNWINQKQADEFTNKVK